MTRWKFLDEALLAQGPVRIPPAVATELGDRLREALLNRDPTEIGDFSTQLEEALRHSLRASSREVQDAARRKPAAEKPATEAYDLGQLAFAQQFAAHAANRRASADFEQQLLGETLSPYIEALARGEMTGTELAETVGHRPETVSRNLKRLRELGAVDFRRERTSLVNFLTPLARRVLAQGEERPARAQLAPSVLKAAQERKQELRPIMRTTQNFASDLALV